MIRRHLLIECAGARLGATLDLPEQPAHAGLLIVSGGNEPRAGPGGAHARLAKRIAEAGYAVLRFDRRGVGDSDGESAGFTESQPDIAAALAALRAAGVSRVLAFGNCDAASALMLGGGCGADLLALANPWTLADGAPAVAALRAHYRRRLANPGALRRLVTGGVSLARLARGLREAAAPVPPPSPLLARMTEGLAQFAGPVSLLIAGRDRTADAFMAAWDRTDPRIAICAAAGHGFLEADSADWLTAQLLQMLRQL